MICGIRILLMKSAPLGNIRYRAIGDIITWNLAPRTMAGNGAHPLAGVGEIEHIVQLLTLEHGRVRRIPLADQLVRLVHAEVVLVAIEACVIQSRPQESEQDAKWSFCLTAGTLCPANQERQ